MSRRLLAIFTVATLVVGLSGCGGSNGSGGSGGGGGVPGPQIIAVAPSTVMQRGPIPATDFLFYLYGQNFGPGSQVFVDGQPATTTVLSPATVKAEYIFSAASVIGTHQLSVKVGSQISNALPFTTYWPQQGPFVMQAIPSYFVGEDDDPSFFAVADINGDGRADVIMPGDPGRTVIMYGQADSSLAVNQTVAGFSPLALAVGDVDGNGTVDLVGISSDASSFTCTASVQLGDGRGNFQPASTSQTFPCIGPGPAQLADLDGDGKPDLVLSIQQAHAAYTSLVWLKNEGGGNFATPATLAQVTSSTPFSVADFNGDGKPDILYFFYDLSTNVRAIHTLLNQGAGKFKDEATPGLSGISVNVINVIDFNVVDFNLDGIPDLVVQIGQSNSDLVTSFAGNGDGSFTQVATQTFFPPDAYGPFILVAGDFDHDGFPDLAGIDGASSPSHAVYLWGDGRGNFTLQEVVGPYGNLVGVGDVNGDGLLDLVVPDLHHFVSVALSRADRNYTGPLSLTPETVVGLSAGDINGDGLPEIFASGDRIFGIPGTVFLNQGNSSFQLAALTDPTSYGLADLTGKGVFDLMGQDGQNHFVWPNNGTLNFTSSSITFPPLSYPTVADVDHDGHPDIVALGQVLYGNSAYQFTPVATSPTFDPPFAVGDFTGNGLLDIGTSTFTFLSSSNRTFTTVRDENKPLTIGNGFTAKVADFNGDGFDDVALIGPGYQEVLICYSYGDGTFYDAVFLDAEQLIGDIVLGDFDGDGRPDIAAALAFSHQVVIFFNQGNGQYTRSFFASGADAIAVIASDLNRDGKQDLVIGNFQYSFAPSNVDVVFHK